MIKAHVTEDLDTRLELSTIQRNHVLNDGRYCWHTIKSETKTNHIYKQFIPQLKKLKVACIFTWACNQKNEALFGTAFNF